MITTLAKLVIIWSQTLIMIPLDGNLEAYKYLPEASLIVDGETVYDEDMYYEYAVNRTFFSVINTKVVGEYRIDYRVHFPTYNKHGDQTIVFKVVDQIKPQITDYKDHHIPLGDQTYDLTLGLKYEDNYDAHDKLKLELIGKQTINYKKVGRYALTYRITDLSKNYIEQTVNVYIYDQLPPTIHQIKPVELNVGEVFVYTNFFEVKDNYDYVINVNVFDEHVNYKKTGYYQVKLSAHDQSNQSSYIMFDLYIKDLEPPKLSLSHQQITWNINSLITKSDLINYISLASDNYDTLSVEDVVIEHLIHVDIPGTYDVTYSLTDQAHNQTTQRLKVLIKDLEPPKIEMQDITIEVFGHIPYFPDFVTITDNVNSVDELTITYTGKVDNKIKGIYEIKIKAVDLEKNESSKTMKIHVIDSTPPAIHLIEKIVISDFKKPEYESYIEIIDAYDKKVKSFFDDTQIDYKKVGVYELYVSAEDESNNQSQLTVYVEVIDVTTPILELYNESVIVMLGDTIDLNRYIKSAYDAHDIHLEAADVSIKSDVDVNKVGAYEVMYILKDLSQNETTKTLKVYVKDLIAPTIEIINPILKKGEPFLFLNHIKAYDNYDGDISHLAVLETKDFNTSKKGIYKLLVSITDSQGNTTFSNMTVTVTDKNPELIMVIGITTIIVITSIIGFFMRKKHHHNASF